MSRKNYDNKYFAAKEAQETANVLLSRANSWYNNLDTNGYLDKIRMMWAAYHGAFFSDFEDGHNLSFSGEQGELVNLAVNHIHNFATIMVNMVTATRPSMQARATNTDHKSLIQTNLANGLLEYYMREKRLEQYLKTATLYAVVLGSGYIKMEWNATSGEIYDYTDDEYETELDKQSGKVSVKLDENGEPVIKKAGIPIYEGDVDFENLSPFDVVFDVNREDQKHDWVLCRSFKNRFDLIAKYPELEDEILSAPTKSDLNQNFIDAFSYDSTDLVPVYEFYHRSTESMPEGRYMLFVSPEAVLMDSPMPYRRLPIYRISAGDILGTPFGYTPLFDILPIQDAINALYSTVLTNQNAFGVQNILVPRGSDVSISELSGGLNIIEANTQVGEIKPLNLTQTPPEVFNFLGMLERVAETISGINSVARGNPESSLKSGTALALVQSQALQYMSGLQQSYVQLIEDVGTGLISMLRDFAEVPRVAMIVGLKNRTALKEFTGDDLSSVNRVVVDIGNPLARTTAGRVEMAEQLLQMGLIKTPEQYEMVLNTGKLDVMTEDTMSELFLIRKENENLVEGKPVIAVITDDHAKHIREHKAVLADPDLRLDPDLVQRTTAHMQEHIEMLRTVDPDLLAIIGEQPLGPKGGTPAGQPQQGVPDQAMQGQAPQVMNPEAVTQAQMPNMPSVPTPPPPFENLPTNPQDMLPQG
jgi:hypothetical protein